jgi:hypothetical protein
MLSLSKTAVPASLAAICVVAVASWLFSDTEAMADAKITIVYTDVQHEVSPKVADWRTDRKRTLTLTSDHKIKSEFDFGWGNRTSSAVLEFGKSYPSTNFTGQSYVTRYTIENGAIVRTMTTDSYSQIIRITTNGTNSCAASVKYRLMKGYKLFMEKRMSNHEDIQMSAWRLENVACTIVSVDN